MRKIQVGIPIIGGKNWLGGVSYIGLLVRALKTLPRNEQPELYLVVKDSTLKEYEIHKDFINYFDRVLFLGKDVENAKEILGTNIGVYHTVDELAQVIDFYFPVNTDIMPGLCYGSWIPDFQHKFLPEFFTKKDIEWRDSKFELIANKSPLTVLSSKHAENQFKYFFPKSNTITKVLSFYSLPDVSWYGIDPTTIQKKYCLPQEYIICCNQFWIHKDHKTLFKALSLLRKEGLDVNLVCTGSTFDYRTKNYFEELQKFISDIKITDLVHILGLIPRLEQIQLIRRSQFLVQPSLFEGWSTVVEDCRALGKPIILSDIEVHLEQNPNHGVYFKQNDPINLAEKIKELLSQSKPGPDLVKERKAKREANKNVKEFANRFMDIINTSQNSKKGRISIPKDVHNEITIATSLAPGNITIQKQAISSWINLGFKVVSINVPEEIEIIKDNYPNVTFVQANRSAKEKYGKPYIYFDDVLAYLEQFRSNICGIVNSDIILKGQDFKEIICREAIDSLVFGARINIENFNNLNGVVYKWGFDYFFFDKKLIPCYPKEEFCLGQPWWDWWIILCPILKGFKVKKIVNPFAYHIKHNLKWNPNNLAYLGFIVSKYFSTDVPMTNDTVIEYAQSVFEKINNSTQNCFIREEKNAPSILVLYNNKGNNIKFSRTYQSIIQQSYPNIRICNVNKEEINLNNVNETYLYYLNEGYCLDRYFFETFVSFIGNEDYGVCGLKRIKNDGNIFGNVFYPIHNTGEKSRFYELNQACILYRKDSFIVNGKFNSRNISTRRMKFIGMGLVEIGLEHFINEKLTGKREIYIYGTGVHTQQLLENINLEDYDFRGVIDKKLELVGKELFGLKVYSIEKLNDPQVKQILISSYSFENEIYEELKAAYSGKELIRLHYRDNLN